MCVRLTKSQFRPLTIKTFRGTRLSMSTNFESVTSPILTVFLAAYKETLETRMVLQVIIRRTQAGFGKLHSYSVNTSLRDSFSLYVLGSPVSSWDVYVIFDAFSFESQNSHSSPLYFGHTLGLSAWCPWWGRGGGTLQNFC